MKFTVQKLLKIMLLREPSWNALLTYYLFSVQAQARIYSLNYD